MEPQPHEKKYEEGYPQVVPCGSCVGCRQEQTRQWAVRMMHEARMHRTNLFATLTYDRKKVPENGALRPRDLTRFVKDLRREGFEFSYYGCGEYGERTARPHYHVCLFGCAPMDRVRNPIPDRSNVWWSGTLEDIWGRGRTELGTITMASASYVAGYVQKKMKAERAVRANSTTGELLEPEFARMSLKPAIGRRWIARHWTDVYPRDYVVVEGFESKPPRYYDKFMDDRFPYIMDAVRDRRYAEYVEMSKYQLMSAEKITKARRSLFAERAGV